MGKWQHIDTAPKDGRPVWARGFNHGNPSAGVHAGYVYWDEELQWVWSGCQSGNRAVYVREWLDTEPLAKANGRR